MKSLLALCILLLAIQCSTAHKGPESKTAQSAAKETGPRLADLTEAGKLGLDFHPSAKPETIEEIELKFEKLCEEKADQCLFLTYRPPRPERSPRTQLQASTRRPLAQWPDSDIRIIAQAGLRQQLAVFGRKRSGDLVGFARRLLQQNECLDASVYLSAAAILERSFPKDDSVQAAMDLHQKSIDCGQTEHSRRSAHRLSFISLWKKQADLAHQALSYAHKHEDSLAERWKWTYWMQSLSRNPDLSRTLSSEVQIQAPSHPTPLSYYSVVVGLQENDLGIQLPDDAQLVPVEVRAAHNDALNLYLQMIELRLKADEKHEARKLVDRIRYEALESNTTDGLKLYLGFLSHQTESGLQTFRFLSPLVRDSGPFANMSVVRLLYPLWHFERIQEIAKSLDVDPWLVVALVRQESAFNTWARSPAGARGLMQLMPATGRMFGVRDRRKLHDPETNLRAGIRFLKNLLRRHDGSLELTLASYNAGPSNVKEWQQRYPTDDISLFVELIPFQETRNYVTSILRNIYWYKRLYESASLEPKPESDSPHPVATVEL